MTFPLPPLNFSTTQGASNAFSQARPPQQQVTPGPDLAAFKPQSQPQSFGALNAVNGQMSYLV